MDLVRDLFEKLNAAGIRYCHWKCNFKLQEAIDGMSDVNLLVEHSMFPTTLVSTRVTRGLCTYMSLPGLSSEEYW
jgi:hypothetical protein